MTQLQPTIEPPVKAKTVAHPVLSVVMCVYNEKETVLSVFRKVQAVPIEKEIIIVDNCSTDGTRELIAPLAGEAKVVFHPHNMGKGASIRTGINHAAGEYVLIQDADLEYDPSDYPALLACAQSTSADAVYGSRVLQGCNTKYLSYYMGVRVLTWLTNFLFRSKLTDVATACKMVKTGVIKQLPLKTSGFDLDFELTDKLIKHGFRVEEVPVAYHPRSFAEGKKIRTRDGVRALWTIVKDRFVD